MLVVFLKIRQLAPLLGYGILVLLVLGQQVVQAALSLGDLHLIQSSPEHQYRKALLWT